VPSVYDLKPRFVALLTPLVAACGRAGVTPNALTVAALVLSAAAGAALLIAPARPAVLAGVAIALLVRMALNAMDGALARTTGLSSRLGEVLNEMGDVAADALIFLPLVRVAPGAWLAIVLLVLFASWSEMAGLLGRALGGARRYEGPMGKSDRALVVGIYLLAKAAGAPAGAWETGLFFALDVLVFFTTVRRLSKGLAA
jgi:CDP-diacylglycerol--glycerol-3-phosphate 3-phosphatidyltransferase